MAQIDTSSPSSIIDSINRVAQQVNTNHVNEAARFDSAAANFNQNGLTRAETVDPKQLGLLDALSTGAGKARFLENAGKTFVGAQPALARFTSNIGSALGQSQGVEDTRASNATATGLANTNIANQEILQKLKLAQPTTSLNGVIGALSSSAKAQSDIAKASGKVELDALKATHAVEKIQLQNEAKLSKAKIANDKILTSIQHQNTIQRMLNATGAKQGMKTKDLIAVSKTIADMNKLPKDIYDPKVVAIPVARLEENGSTTILGRAQTPMQQQYNQRQVQAARMLAMVAGDNQQANPNPSTILLVEKRQANSDTFGNGADISGKVEAINVPTELVGEINAIMERHNGVFDLNTMEELKALLGALPDGDPKEEALLQFMAQNVGGM